jgi:hypothetical protein
MWILDNEYNPFLLAFLGCAACLGAFVAWIMTGRKEAIYAGAGLLVIFIGLIITERMNISDREAIQAQLVQTARDLEANNYAAVYGFIHPKSNDMLLQAQSELPGYRFDECRITKIYQTKIDEKANPKTAVVEFNIIAKGTFKQASDSYPGQIPRFIRLNLEKDQDGKWKATNYFHDSPEQAIMERK